MYNFGLDFFLEFQMPVLSEPGPTPAKLLRFQNALTCIRTKDPATTH